MLKSNRASNENLRKILIFFFHFSAWPAWSAGVTVDIKCSVEYTFLSTVKAKPVYIRMKFNYHTNHSVSYHDFFVFCLQTSHILALLMYWKVKQSLFNNLSLNKLSRKTNETLKVLKNAWMWYLRAWLNGEQGGGSRLMARFDDL